MEPIASSVVGATFRPLTSSAELNALLRNGRVLGAEVLEPGDGGGLLLALGRHTIPAESDLRFDPGQRFLVRVVRTAEGTVLEILTASTGQDESLLAALRAAVDDGRPLGTVLGELARSLRLALAREPSPALQSLAQGLAAAVALAVGDGPGLRRLLASLGLGHESALAALLVGRAGSGELESLRKDLKALLLGTEAALEADGKDATLRTLVGRALKGLESEQLLNLARDRAGEPALLSLPFSDPGLEPEAWSTARLLVHRREHEGARDEDEAPFRVTVGLELSRLGPLRADFTLTPRLLALRLLVTREDVARGVASGIELLRRRMGDGRRAVDLQVRVGTRAEAEAGLQPLDIRYLHEHHLMNIDG